MKSNQANTIQRVKVGECIVDTGLLMVGDPCGFLGKEAEIHRKCPDWTTACGDIFAGGPELDAGCDVCGLGVAVSTTHGDGRYPVYLESCHGKRYLVVELD